MPPVRLIGSVQDIDELAVLLGRTFKPAAIVIVIEAAAIASLTITPDIRPERQCAAKGEWKRREALPQ